MARPGATGYNAAVWPFKDKLRPTALVADDDMATRALLTSALEGMGWEVHCAADGAEALSEARKKSPDVIVLDIDMPKMNGLDALRALRARPETAKTPVVMVTARSTLEVIEACLAAGANDYIIKPFDLVQVRGKISKLLQAPP